MTSASSASIQRSQSQMVRMSEVEIAKTKVYKPLVRRLLIGSARKLPCWNVGPGMLGIWFMQEARNRDLSCQIS